MSEEQKLSFSSSLDSGHHVAVVLVSRCNELFTLYIIFTLANNTKERNSFLKRETIRRSEIR